MNKEEIREDEERQEKVDQLLQEIDAIEKDRFNYTMGSLEYNKRTDQVSALEKEALSYFSWVTVSYVDILKNLPILVYGRYPYPNNYRSDHDVVHSLVKVTQHKRKGINYTAFWCGNCKKRIAFIQTTRLDESQEDIPWREARKYNIKGKHTQ